MRLGLLAAVLVIICAMAPAALAADRTLNEAINCADFKHNPDGSWYAKSVTLEYGPGNKTQTNSFDHTITSKDGEIFTDLNEKCGAGR
jgi:hypothetical protein